MSGDRPRPVPDAQTRPYWAGLQRRVLLVQFCGQCARHVHPAKPCCPDCLETELSWVEVSGSGVVVGYCVVAQPFVGLAAPYTVVRVSLLDATTVELIGDLVGAGPSASGEVAIGSRVEVEYEVVDDELTLAQFGLVRSLPVEGRA